MFAVALRIFATVLFLVGLILVIVGSGGAAANLPEIFLLGGLAAFAASFLPVP